jgi:hypothetical protein
VLHSNNLEFPVAPQDPQRNRHWKGGLLRQFPIFYRIHRLKPGKYGPCAGRTKTIGKAEENRSDRQQASREDELYTLTIVLGQAGPLSLSRPGLLSEEDRDPSSIYADRVKRECDRGQLTKQRHG